VRYAKKNIVDYEEFVSDNEKEEEKLPISCVKDMKIEALPELPSEEIIVEDLKKMSLSKPSEPI
jgi:hypothetical protein